MARIRLAVAVRMLEALARYNFASPEVVTGDKEAPGARMLGEMCVNPHVIEAAMNRGVIVSKLASIYNNRLTALRSLRHCKSLLISWI